MRGPTAAVGAALVAAAGSWPSALALFEDEVGQYEWNLQQIGMPTAFTYAEPTDRIFVASASGVVASVNLKDGTMPWRRVASTSSAVRLLRAAGRTLVGVTEAGAVQAWKATSGDLAWQREYTETVLDVMLAGKGSKTQSVFVLRDDELEARSLSGGAHEWSAAASAAAGTSGRFRALAPSPEEGRLCAVATSSEGASALRIDAADGKVLDKKGLPAVVAQGLRQGGSHMVTDSHLVFLSKEEITVVPVCGGESVEFELSKVTAKQQGSGGPFHLMPWQRTPGVFAISDGAMTAVIGIGSQGLKLLRTFEGTAVVGPIVSVHEDEVGQPVAVAITEKDGTRIQLMDPASGNAQPAMVAKGYSATEHGTARLLLVHELSSGEHRTVLSAADHSFAGIQGGKAMWVREEALASVRKAAFYSRTAAATLAERLAHPEDEAAGLGALAAQLSALPVRAAELVSEPARLVAAFTAWVTPKRRRTGREINLLPGAMVPTASEELRDFGADKLIIAVTRAAKVFALEATTSEVVWSMYLGAPADQDCLRTDACTPWMELLPSVSAPVSDLLVVAHSPGGGQEAFWLEPLEGKVLHRETVPTGAATVAAVVPLHKRGVPATATEVTHQELQPFILIDSKRGVHTLPAKSPEAKRLAAESASTLFHYEVDGTAQAVQGYAFSPLSAQQQRHELVRLWNLELGSAGEKVVAAASPEHRDWDHVPVHIKGDATILYKYINANMLAVATEDMSDNASSLNLYVLDSVTGHVLHQTHIPGGAGPVNLVTCDNWVVMHYQNPKRTRFEITVVELFQAKADDGPWDIIFGGHHMKNHTKSAHHLETPVPLQQTYIFPAGVTTMGVTATLKGITPRSIMMALTTEQILRVSKDWLNPRRPFPQKDSAIAGTKEKSGMPAQFAPSKEEVLPPYSPLVGVKPTDVLNYYIPMPKVAGIISSPSALESTSLVFSYGLDLLFAPVQSAKAYDVLSPGFNYVFVYLSVTLVVAVWAVTSVWASKKALQDRWK